MLGKKYLDSIIEILGKVQATQMENIRESAIIIVEAILNKNTIYAFGSNHAALLAQELFYRTGGLAIINPITAPGLQLDTYPIQLTTAIERLDGYGKAIIENSNIKKGDVIIIHSVSGRNNVPIDVAIHSKKMGAKIIVLTNMDYSTKVESRHPSGKKLYEIGDVVIDNCGNYGDAVLEVDGLPQKIAPSSTAIGAAILNAVVAEVVEILQNKNIMPPIFISSNVEGGDEHNAKILREYKDNIFYA